MNLQDLEARFGALKQQHDAGSLSEADFDREREQLKTQDERGVWWTKDRTGDWYFHDGTRWQQGHPQLMGGHPSGPMPAATGWSADPHARSQGNAGLMVGLGIGSAVLALIVLPIVFGPLGIFFGYRATKLGNRSGGRGVMIASAVCMVVSMVIGAIVLTSMR